MPDFTTPNGDPLHEVNHCHGPGPGHPCKAGEGGERSADTQRSGAETVIYARAKDLAKELAGGGDVAAQARNELALYPADSPMHRYVAELTPKPRQTNAQKMKDRAAGMRRQRLAAGGWSAEKQRKRDFQMAKGRQTQKMVRAIRKREE